ncbi:MAG: PIN domain-containing protein [Chloroflexota bacterium]
MILLDSSGLLAAIDSRERDHSEAVGALGAAEPPFLLSPFVLAELDYFLARRVGNRAEIALLDEVAAGAYQLEPFDRRDVAAALEVMTKYSDLDIGLADASIVVLADRHDVSDVLTLDERHFRSLRRAGGKAFRLLPFGER